jgi:hypothetical protein
MKKQNYNTGDYDNFSINEVNTMFQNKQLDILLEKKQDENAPNTVRKQKIYITYQDLQLQFLLDFICLITL